MAKCLRCGAGNEWLKGEVPEDNDEINRLHTEIEYLKTKLVEHIDSKGKSLCKQAFENLFAEKERWFNTAECHIVVIEDKQKEIADLERQLTERDKRIAELEAVVKESGKP